MIIVRLFKRAAFRRFHTSNIVCLDPKNVEEVRIPVPWGHVAGKWWGGKDAQPILALHGWQDNAGSWDPFLKVMPGCTPVLAIDFPGSGISSHLPHFLHYHFIDSAQVVERIRQYFDFGPLTLLGHSGGSATSFVYSAIYPENVEGYFGIDYLLYSYSNHKKRAEQIGSLIDHIITLALRDPAHAKRYTWEEAKEAWIKATFGSLNEESAEILMQRGVSKLPDGKVVFNRDSRIKSRLLEAPTVAQVESMAHNIDCHVVLVKGALSPMFQRGIKHSPHILDIVKKHAKSYEFHEISGGHHLHMDVPEVIVPILQSFLHRIKS